MLYIIPVPGTGEQDPVLAHARGADGKGMPAWWSPESPFAHILKANLEKSGVKSSQIRWSALEKSAWSCANSENARIKAGRALAKKLIKLWTETSGSKEFLLIGYSHGGNVALEALAELHRRGARYEALLKRIRLSLIGTPIFNYKTSGLNYLSRLVFGGFLPSLIWPFFFTILPLFLLFTVIKDEFIAKALTPALKSFLPSAWSTMIEAHPALIALGVSGIICLIWGAVFFFRKLEETRSRLNLMRQLRARANVGNVDDLADTASAAVAATAPNSGLENSDTRPPILADDHAPDSASGESKTAIPVASDQAGEIASTAAERDSKMASMNKAFKAVIEEAMVLFANHDEAYSVLKWAADRKPLLLTTPSLVRGLTKALVFTCLFLPYSVFMACSSAWLPQLFSEKVFPLPHTPLPVPVDYMPFWIMIGLGFLIFWLVSWPLSQAVSPLINSLVRMLMRQRVLGDDNFARPIEDVTQVIPQKDHAHDWSRMPFWDEHETFVHENAGQAWMQIRNSLIFAGLTENWNLVEQLEKSTHVSWNSLLHTTYFISPLTTHFIAYVVLRSADAFKTDEAFGLQVYPPNWRDVYKNDAVTLATYERLENPDSGTKTFAAELERMRPAVTGAPSK